MADANWLLSSVVQSSAAIVAILGGFITASILSRVGAREELERQQSVIKARKLAAEQHRSKLHAQWSKERIEEAIEDAATNYLKDRHATLDLTSARATISLPDDIPNEMFGAEWKRYIDDVRDWSENLINLLANERPRQSEDFHSWSNRLDLEIPDQLSGAVEVIYDEVLRRRSQGATNDLR